MTAHIPDTIPVPAGLTPEEWEEYYKMFPDDALDNPHHI